MIIDDRTFELLKYEISNVELRLQAIDSLKVGDEIKVIAHYGKTEKIKITKISNNYGLIDGFCIERNEVDFGIDLLEILPMSEINRLTGVIE